MGVEKGGGGVAVLGSETSHGTEEIDPSGGCEPDLSAVHVLPVAPWSRFSLFLAVIVFLGLVGGAALLALDFGWARFYDEDWEVHTMFRFAFEKYSGAWLLLVPTAVLLFLCSSLAIVSLALPERAGRRLFHAGMVLSAFLVAALAGTIIGLVLMVALGVLESFLPGPGLFLGLGGGIAILTLFHRMRGMVAVHGDQAPEDAPPYGIDDVASGKPI